MDFQHLLRTVHFAAGNQCGGKELTIEGEGYGQKQPGMFPGRFCFTLHMRSNLPASPYARGEVGKAADAAALAAAARIDVPHYREIGEIRFLSDARAMAQNFASMNSTFLRSRHIGVGVTRISVNSANRQVSVTVAADLSSLIPGILPFQEEFAITGYVEAMVNGR